MSCACLTSGVHIGGGWHSWCSAREWKWVWGKKELERRGESIPSPDVLCSQTQPTSINLLGHTCVYCSLNTFDQLSKLRIFFPWRIVIPRINVSQHSSAHTLYLIICEAGFRCYKLVLYIKVLMLPCNMHVAQCDLMPCHFISRPYYLHLCNFVTLISQINDFEMLNYIAGDIFYLQCGTLQEMPQLH